MVAVCKTLEYKWWLSSEDRSMHLMIAIWWYDDCIYDCNLYYLLMMVLLYWKSISNYDLTPQFYRSSWSQIIVIIQQSYSSSIAHVLNMAIEGFATICHSIAQQCAYVTGKCIHHRSDKMHTRHCYRCHSTLYM